MAMFQCPACQATAPRRFAITCPECGAPGPYVEVTAPVRSARSAAATERAPAPSGRLVRLSQVPASEGQRIRTGSAELDRVFGGGLVAGSLVLLAGEPGIGKSTLLIELVARLVAKGHQAMYASGEESAAQIRLRAERLGLALDDLPVLADTDVTVVAATIAAERPQVVVVDSVQTLSSPDSSGVEGGSSQIREVTRALAKVAHETGSTLVLVGHVTKDNAVAGPQTLQHLVDAVFVLEGEPHGFARVLRATKNRFGATDEVARFEMNDTGLVPVEDPGPMLLEGGESFGRAVCPVLAGSRSLLVEVTALVSKASYASARRIAIGVPEKRVSMLLAVLERYTGLDLSAHDVYVSTSAGLIVNEPAIDAAICAAIASSARALPIEERTVVAGEVRLGGGVGPVRAMPSRAKAAAQSGFGTLVGPAGAEIASPRYVGVRNVAELLAALGVAEGELAVEGYRRPAFTVKQGADAPAA